MELRLTRSPQTYVPILRGSPVVVNGVMYVLLSRVRSNGELLRFDLETEEWKKAIQGPERVTDPVVWKRTRLVRITELNGTLCMVQSEILMTNIWLLSDSSKDVWINMYTMRIAFDTYPTPLKMVRDDDRLIFRCASPNRKGQIIQIYDPNNTRATLPRLGGRNTIKIGLCSLHLDRFISANI